MVRNAGTKNRGMTMTQDRSVTDERSRYLAAIVESSEDAIITKDLHGIITSWNRAAEKMFGYTEKEALGQPISIIGTPDRINEFKEIIEKVAKGIKIERYETQRKRKDGTVVDVWVTVSPVKNEEGKLIGLSVIDRDITSQKQASQYARSLAAIVQSSEDAVISEALDGTVTSWNPAAERMFGYSDREAIGQPISIIGTPDRINEFREIIEKVMKGITVERYETQRKRKDGTVVDVWVTVSPVRNEEGKLIGLSAIDRDITSQRQASQYARSLAAIVQSSEDAVISEALDGTVTSWNPAAERMFGYSDKEALSQPISIIATPDRVDEFKEIIDKVKKGITVERYETQRKRKDGTVVDVWVTVSPVRNEEGKLIGLSAIDRDITALKQASQYARSLIEASLDPLVTISADGTITDVNEATIKVTGVRRERLIGTDFSNYFTEPEKARDGYQLVFSKGTVTDYPLTIRHVDGKLTDVLYNASVYKDIRGNVSGVFAAARDVTAQKQASQYARSLIEASLDPLVTISPDGKITDINEATIRVTGMSRDKLIGTDFSDYFTEPEKASEGYQLVFSKGTVTDYPLTIRHNDGKLTDVLYNASVYKDVAGNVLGVFAAARDVTAQKQASQYARSLIEASLDPLVTISPDGKITDVNEATIRVTGMSRDKLIGTDFSNYFIEPEKAREGYQQVLAQGYVTDYPLTIRHRDGKLTDVLYNASVYNDVSGNVLGVFAAARDITAQRKAEAQVAEQRTKELERLAELERFQKLTVGRELKMIELKKEIEELRRRLGQTA
ncbi:MAG: PAS domain S-box protein [Chloroflexi bacterium]|nr:PAS domain S-box protein [Chloroflexota bacterium]